MTGTPIPVVFPFSYRLLLLTANSEHRSDPFTGNEPQFCS